MDSTESKQSSERISTNQATTTTAVDTTLDMNHTTININREFHNEETSTYWLPKDEDEQQRLTGQHFAFKELFEGNISRSVREALDFEKGISVLDVGCGSGVWIMDMINDYPNCTYHGCDIADATNKVLKVNQFTYSHGNVATGLPYEDSTFDFVHMRFLTLALRKEEWPPAIKELLRVVKPGGMIQLMEFELLSPDDSSSAFYKLAKSMHSVALSRGQNMEAFSQLEELLLETKMAKVVQQDYRRCNMSSNTVTAKKLAWDIVEGAKSVMPAIKPIVGLKSKEDILKFLAELRYCITHTDCYFNANSVSAQKL
ncbi:hypothetical protein G6F29_003953 [Rhizopus arrhizus]|nr:hypothetical protein G6F18_009604 [Rhizopus arrhizus]KAG0908386.1 hypothetical protein G6F33_009739 [Rhizopus arrhizus]KAG0985537.1 hypothetical protein G6F29_003953 [Rhizopus arrhizus]KAG1004533.1 hypothetical protein G6F27_010053 [Rhizopus arrhizus]KAG1064458.1 hypothetical protein G6F41_010023 [Rhizopus arrhizus]